LNLLESSLKQLFKNLKQLIFDMSIVQDVPGELKQFARLFDKLSYRNSDYGSVFSDWTSYLFGGMLLEGDPELADELKRRYGEDYPIFLDLNREMLVAYDKGINCAYGWYDGIGIFYETIASRYKSKALGQFFTPAPIIELMAALVEIKPEGERAIDPCAGSGRFLLSAHVKNPRIRCYASDVDPVCVRMAAINMAIHGCRGEVAHTNALSLEWWAAYEINPLFSITGCPPVPHIKPLSKEQSSFYYPPKKEVTEPVQVEIKKAVERVKAEQLTLF
jgi:type I restriction enzyme M protein